MKKTLYVALAAAFAFGSYAVAGDPPLAAGSPGTCSNPLPLTSEGGAHDHVTPDTCDYGNELGNMGGTPSATNDVIYSFVAQGANATITVSGTDPNAVAYLMPACTSATNPTNFAFGGVPMTVSGLTDGQTYYINVTHDATAGADLCGTVTMDVEGTLPVELQKISVN